jgi:hypothetical protein
MNLSQQLRKANREYLHSIWTVAQTGDMDSLSDEDRSLVGIMLEHDEYHNQFEIADLLHDHNYDVESEVNPFLHVVFHQIIENQLESRDPIETFQFYNVMRKNKVSRHEVIHCIATIFSFLLHGVLTGTAEFDIEKYRSLLKRFKNKKPDKLMHALEKEFDID